MEIDRKSFETAVELDGKELARERRNAKLVKVLTLGLASREAHVRRAEARYSESIADLRKYEELLAKKEHITCDLSDCAALEGARISEGGHSSTGVLGGQDYGDNWDSISRAVLERDDYTCQEEDGFCSGPLQAHHQVPLSKGGTHSYDNLITLCLFHHSQKHDHMRR